MTNETLGNTILGVTLIGSVAAICGCRLYNHGHRKGYEKAMNDASEDFDEIFEDMLEEEIRNSKTLPEVNMEDK